MARKRMLTKRAAEAARFDDLDAVAKAFSGFRPAHEVLTRVRAVPTIFPQFDHATKVGGFPIERITLVHGPSGEGKTSFTLGLAKSFLALNHPVYFIDAERTTPRSWIDTALGPHATSPIFKALRPETYEETVKEVREFCNLLRDFRAKGHEQTSGLVVVDSIRKLVPKDQWDKINKPAKDDDGKVRDRSAQQKASMNANWCDELIPLLEKSGAGMVIIARETQDPNADIRARMYGTDYVVGGGKALYYDASLDCRIDRQRFVTKETKEGTKPTVYGERHRVSIKKSKVAGKEDRTVLCYFHSSNGQLVPEGFDRARDVLELARRFGVVKGDSWMKWRSCKWQGEHAAVRKLTSEPELLAGLEAEVREHFKTVNPLEITPDGEVAE